MSASVEKSQKAATELYWLDIGRVRQAGRIGQGRENSEIEMKLNGEGTAI